MALNTLMRRMVRKLGTTSDYVTGEPVVGEVICRVGDNLETRLRKTPSNRAYLSGRLYCETSTKL